MITLLSMLEEGYLSSFEHLAFRQLKGAYGCNLISIPHDYPTLQDGLDAAIGTKVFLCPPGRVVHSVEMKDATLPSGDVVFVFGSPQEDLTSFITETDIVYHITTPNPVDIMAVSAAGIVLNEYG